jgi:hypothetical protein
MVIRWLSHMQIGPFRSSSTVLTALACFALTLSGCRSWPSGSYRGSVTGRVIEFQAGIAYITEGRSTQAISYDVDGEKVILNLPFTNEVLHRLPDGTLSGMGETLLHIEGSAAKVRGIYASEEDKYTLPLSTRRTAVCTCLERSTKLTCTNRDDIHVVLPVVRTTPSNSEAILCEES